MATETTKLDVQTSFSLYYLSYMIHYTSFVTLIIIGTLIALYRFIMQIWITRK